MNIRMSVTAIAAALMMSACGKPEPTLDTDGILVVNADNLTETLKESSGLMLAHFSSYDANCGYCIASNSYLNALAKEYSDTLKIARLTWEPWNAYSTADPELTDEYWLRGLPTMILYKDGEEVWRGTGHSEKHLNDLVELLNE